jgi:hypothetical protein
MVTRKTVGVMIAGVGLVLASALISGARGVSRPVAPPALQGVPTPWAVHLSTVDAALSAGDVPGAVTAWRAAYGAALGSRRWEGLADIADAYLAIGRASGAPAAAMPRARDLYLSALFRARDAGSLDGVLRIATAFDRLGDREVTLNAVQMARRLAGPHPAPSVRERLADLDAEPAIPVF